MIKKISGKEKSLIVNCFILLLMVVFIILDLFDCNADTLDQFKNAKEEYREFFRINGKPNTELEKNIEEGVNRLIENSEGKLLAQALFELADMQRMQNHFDKAINNYERAAAIAKKHSDSESELNAMIGIARSYNHDDIHDYNKASAALDKAIDVVGNTSTKKQRYDIAGYSSQLQEKRGELEAALLNALEAVELAQDAPQRFFSLSDVGNILYKFAQSCNYRKLIDAKSFNESDEWGACKRAAGEAISYKKKAKKIAEEKGWTFLIRIMANAISHIKTQLFLINMKVELDNQLVQLDLFKAQSVNDPDLLINEKFFTDLSKRSGQFFSDGLRQVQKFAFAYIIDYVASQVPSNTPAKSNLKSQSDLMKGNLEQSLSHLKNTAKLLRTERATLFDLRQRGTVIEKLPLAIQNLGRRLLELKQYNEAFITFESLRSHGLGWLANVFEKENFTDIERKWISDLVQLDSSISAKLNKLVETTIAGIEHSRSSELKKEINLLKQQRLELQQKKQFQGIIERLKTIQYELPSMIQLKKSVDQTNIPVLLYWVGTYDVIVWVISPDGIEVKSVFLSESAVIDKVTKLRASLETQNKSFDTTSAKELHTYLIKPFEKFLKYNQVIIIPQGPLVGLPFETLIDAETEKFTAQTLSVSYAPNADFAVHILERGLPVTDKITVLYDKKIEDSSHELLKIEEVKGITIRKHSSGSTTPKEFTKLLESATSVHLLLHGLYDNDDPLQSSIKLNPGNSFSAANLLSIDWRNTQLAVLSSCEGALVKTRISNEQFGISWTLLAGGVDHLILSRWRVNAANNADWMKIFYTSMKTEKMSPALAANTAMRKMIINGQDPYYWAGSKVFGR